ncbi:protease inhibitor I42 family protein [Streptomyces sp. NPDC004562]|uniref:protease inhibitor I42 family protein n=1 Tax=Streptomyces sp. NPDC004562 TaxID=3364703 RepID=UPI00369509B0
MTMLAGCGDPGPETCELGENRTRVDPGEEFTLSVLVDTAMGERWYLTSPDLDPDVVRRTDRRQEIQADDDDVGSGSGTGLFDFKAVGPGTTQIRLIQCPRGACAGGGSAGGPVTPSPVPSGSPTPDEKYRATVHTYTVTVRKS